MKTVHVIGDSISIHYGPYLAAYIAPYAHYSRKTGKIGNLDNPEGANGGDSAMVLDYLRTCIDAGRHWDLLLINCGLHDIKRYTGLRQINPAAYERNVSRIFDLAGHLSHRCLWLRTTPVIDAIHQARMQEFLRFNADVETYNAIADAVAAAKGVGVIDLYTFCQTLGGAEIYQDHVHFTPEVQQLQAAFIAGAVQGFLATAPVLSKR